MENAAGKRRRSRGGTIAWSALAVVLVGVLVVLAWAMASGTGSRLSGAAASFSEGDRAAAPALPTEALGEGLGPTVDQYDPSSANPWRGITIVNFWASWCGPCREEMPFLSGLHGAYSDQGVTVIGVNIDDDRDDALEFADEYDVDFPLVVAGPDARREWGLRGQPETFVVDSDGLIASHVPGPIEDGTLRPVVEELLAAG